MFTWLHTGATVMLERTIHIRQIHTDLTYPSYCTHIPQRVNTKHLYNICTMGPTLVPLCTNVIQMFCVTGINVLFKHYDLQHTFWSTPLSQNSLKTLVSGAYLGNPWGYFFPIRHTHHIKGADVHFACYTMLYHVHDHWLYLWPYFHLY